MRASKENAVKALSAVDRLQQYAGSLPKQREDDLRFIGDFLASAAKRLPREESLEKDSKRVRTKKAKT